MLLWHSILSSELTLKHAHLYILLRAPPFTLAPSLPFVLHFLCRDFSVYLHSALTSQFALHSCQDEGTQKPSRFNVNRRICFSVIKHQSGSFIYEPESIPKCCEGLFTYPIKFMHHRMPRRFFDQNRSFSVCQSRRPVVAMTQNFPFGVG